MGVGNFPRPCQSVKVPVLWRGLFYGVEITVKTEYSTLRLPQQAVKHTVLKHLGKPEQENACKGSGPFRGRLSRLSSGVRFHQTGRHNIRCLRTNVPPGSLLVYLQINLQDWIGIMKKTIICCLFAIALLLSACGPRTQETVETTAPMTETVVEECVAAASEAAPEGSATAPPETTVPPSTSPEMTTEPLPAPQLHSGLMEDGSFSEGVLFLGDSQTCIFVEQYLKPQGVLGGAKTAAQCGASVNHFWNVRC